MTNLSDKNVINRITPIKRIVKWSSSKKAFTYYDGATKTTQTLPVPFTFDVIIEENRARIEGFNDKAQKGFWSNEINSFSKVAEEKVFSVRWNGGSEFLNGQYKDIKADVDAMGGNYYRSIYATVNNNGTLEIWNIRLKGAALSVYSNISKGLNGLCAKQLTLVGSTQEKKGAVTYFNPEFKVTLPSVEMVEKATILNSELEEFLNSQPAIKSMPTLTNEEKSQIVKPGKSNTDKFQSMDADDFLNA